MDDSGKDGLYDPSGSKGVAGTICEHALQRGSFWHDRAKNWGASTGTCFQSMNKYNDITRSMYVTCWNYLHMCMHAEQLMYLFTCQRILDFYVYIFEHLSTWQKFRMNRLAFSELHVSKSVAKQRKPIGDSASFCRCSTFIRQSPICIHLQMYQYVTNIWTNVYSNLTCWALYVCFQTLWVWYGSGCFATIRHFIWNSFNKFQVLRHGYRRFGWPVAGGSLGLLIEQGSAMCPPGSYL